MRCNPSATTAGRDDPCTDRPPSSGYRGPPRGHQTSHLFNRIDDLREKPPVAGVAEVVGEFEEDEPGGDDRAVDAVEFNRLLMRGILAVEQGEEKERIGEAGVHPAIRPRFWSRRYWSC